MYLAADAFGCLVGDGLVDRVEVRPGPGPHPPRPKRVAEEGERPSAAPFAVLAVHDPGLVGVQLQPSALGQPVRDRITDPLRLLLCLRYFLS